jgi:hypothetical protein
LISLIQHLHAFHAPDRNIQNPVYNIQAHIRATKFTAYPNVPVPFVNEEPERTYAHLNRIFVQVFNRRPQVRPGSMGVTPSDQEHVAYLEFRELQNSTPSTYPHVFGKVAGATRNFFKDPPDFAWVSASVVISQPEGAGGSLFFFLHIRQPADSHPGTSQIPNMLS